MSTSLLTRFCDPSFDLFFSHWVVFGSPTFVFGVPIVQGGWMWCEKTECDFSRRVPLATEESKCLNECNRRLFYQRKTHSKQARKLIKSSRVIRAPFSRTFLCRYKKGQFAKVAVDDRFRKLVYDSRRISDTQS